MKYALEGLALSVIAESIRDAALIVDHFRELRLGLLYSDDPEKLKASLARASDTLKSVETGDLVHQDLATEKRPWFPASTELGPNSIKPYMDLLKRVTRYAGDLPESEFVPSDAGLHHTHAMAKCLVSSRGIKASGFIQSEDWGGQPADVRARVNFHDYVVEGFGYRKHEEEFTQVGNGQYVKNPSYLKRLAPQSGLGSPELWKQIFGWWRKTHATPGQEAVLQFAEAHKLSWQLAMDWDIRKGGGNEAGLVGYNGLHLAYSGNNAVNMSWAEFAELKTWAPVPETEDAPATEDSAGQ
jgi:hypothetical protein